MQSEPKLSQSAQFVWERCEEYATTYGLKQLELAGYRHDRSGDKSYDFGPEYLRVSFLFPRPGPTDDFLKEVVHMRFCKWALDLAKKTATQDQSPVASHALEQAEASYAEQRKLIEPTLRDLPPVLQEIIRVKFF